jgi:hypothetical protein
MPQAQVQWVLTLASARALERNRAICSCPLDLNGPAYWTSQAIDSQRARCLARAERTELDASGGVYGRPNGKFPLTTSRLDSVKRRIRSKSAPRVQ